MSVTNITLNFPSLLITKRRTEESISYHFISLSLSLSLSPLFPSHISISLSPFSYLHFSIPLSFSYSHSYIFKYPIKPTFYFSKTKNRIALLQDFHTLLYISLALSKKKRKEKKEEKNKSNIIPSAKTKDQRAKEDRFFIRGTSLCYLSLSHHIPLTSTNPLPLALALLLLLLFVSFLLLPLPFPLPFSFSQFTVHKFTSSTLIPISNPRFQFTIHNSNHQTNTNPSFIHSFLFLFLSIYLPIDPSFDPPNFPIC